MNVVVLGLSLSSSWGNGHATTYRALLKAFAARGHDILFLERDVPWYADNRDLSSPTYCELAFYRDLAGLRRYKGRMAAADAVIVGSYVPDGIEVGDLVLGCTRGLTAFYDIDTPVTLAGLRATGCTYLAKRQIPSFDLYLSFTGGPTLQELQNSYGARCARPLYCSVDTQTFQPQRIEKRWHLGYLGTYSADRQPKLERLLIEPARRRPDLNFVVAGAQFPETIDWPRNVARIPHLPPAKLPEFFSSIEWALNITRADMVKAGWSPSVRLFEAAACGAPLISDNWPGLADTLMPGTEILTADTAEDVLAALARPRMRRQRIADAARRRVLAVHSADHRALELESWLMSALAARRSTPRVRRPVREATPLGETSR